MTQEGWTKVWKFVAAVALALAAFATALGGIAVWSTPEEAVSRGYQCNVYTEQGCAKFVVASGGEVEVQSGGTVDFQSGATVGFDAVTASGVLDMDSNIITNIGVAGTDFGSDGALTLAKSLTVSDGDVIVADDLRVAAQTSITVTNGAAFTPTGTYQNITAAGEVTPTITIATAGDLLVLINTSAQTINIADSGTMMLSAAVALGQYDSLTLWCDGTNWIQIATSNN